MLLMQNVPSAAEKYKKAINAGQKDALVCLARNLQSREGSVQMDTKYAVALLKEAT